MMYLKLLLLVLVYNVHMCVWSKKVNGESLMDISINHNEIYTYNKTNLNIMSTQVDVKWYYECLCPRCRRFGLRNFQIAVQKFGDHIKINTYPYGLSKTIIDEDAGTVTFSCQHGPAECYGNKLHACALDIIQNHTEALLYNSCLLSCDYFEQGSDDYTADNCGADLNLDSDPIKECAKGIKGTQLLKRYGDETAKINLPYVPYILVNSKVSSPDTFIKDICDAFPIPPPECKDNIM